MKTSNEMKGFISKIFIVCVLYVILLGRLNREGLEELYLYKHEENKK
jgi:hypothetical protein